MANVHLQDYSPEQSCYDELLNSLPRSWRPDLNEAGPISMQGLRTRVIPVTYLCRSKCLFELPSLQIRPVFSSRVLSAVGADCRSH